MTTDESDAAATDEAPGPDSDLGSGDDGGEDGLLRAARLVGDVLPWVRPYWKEAFGSVVLLVALVLLGIAQPWPLAFVADSVLDDAREPPSWVIGLFGDSTGGLIVFAVVATLAITLLAGVCTVVQKFLTTRINEGMSLDFRSKLFEHVQHLPVAWHDTRETGMLLFRLNTQSRAIGQIATSLPLIAQHLLTVAAMGFVAYRIDPVLALIAMAVVPFVFVSIRYYAERIEPQLLRVRGMEGRNMSIIHEAVQMVRVVVAFGREDHEHERFHRQAATTADARVSLTLRQTVFRMCIALVTACGTAGVLGVGASRVIDGDLSLGELLVVLAYVAAVYAPIEAMTSLLVGFQAQLISFEHAQELLNEKPDIIDAPGAVEATGVLGALAVRDLAFSYPTRPDTLIDINFDLDAGTTLAIVGPTGAGKSTLVGLLPRFYDLDAGSIEIDGTDIGAFTLASLRRQFSIVPQEPLLFSGSVAENIRYARPEATPAEVRSAARLANAHDFIEMLPDGYQTRLGERGARLSGGERQRLAVARAFLRDAPFLILDEPTSSIDSRTEAPVLDAVERLRTGRTTIIIAHRLATIRHADAVLVLDDGRMVQFGTFDELVFEDGLLRELWAAQTGVEIAHDPVEQIAETTSVRIDPNLVLEPISRRPIKLDPSSVDSAWLAPIPSGVHKWSRDPDASIVVPVRGNLVVTRLGLESILGASVSATFELIVVDNASDALTAHYLRRLAELNPNVRLVRNDENRGFAAAVNQGLRLARGANYVIANNDIMATPAWLDGLLAALRDQSIGLVGPVTNRCGNEAEVGDEYRTVGELDDVARRRRWLPPIDVRDIGVSIMFCTALRRDTFDDVGELDERFGLGLFEDDDYSRRVRAAHRRVTVADTVFVHHFGEATIGDLAATGAAGELFHDNRRRFEEKWGEPWVPHRRRIDPAYDELRRRVRFAIEQHTPSGAHVAVVSRGDEALIELSGRTGRHFPSLEDGCYSGHHPADDDEAIDLLERLRLDGVECLVVPAASAWWLDTYSGLGAHLSVIAETTTIEGVAHIFTLDPTEGSARDAIA